MTPTQLTREVLKEVRASRLGVFFMSLGMIIAVLSITIITSLGEGTRIKITEILQQLNFGSKATGIPQRLGGCPGQPEI